MTSVSHARATIIRLPRVVDRRGCLSFGENAVHLPFAINRVFLIYEVPAAATRGGHAHHSLHELLIAAAGSFEVSVDDGRSGRRYRLDSPTEALYLPPMYWHVLHEFSPGAVCLVLASAPYEEADYIRDYTLFRRKAGREHGAVPGSDGRLPGAAG